MGDYIYMRGTATIKSALREIVRPMFGESNYEKRVGWAGLGLPDDLMASKYMMAILEYSKDYDGDWFPDSWGSAVAGFGDSGPGKGVLTYSADGVLEFSTSSKNRGNVQENFAALLILMSDKYEIEQDYHEAAFEINFDYDQVYTWSSEQPQSPLLIEALIRERLDIEEHSHMKIYHPMKLFRGDSVPNGKGWKAPGETRELRADIRIEQEDLDDVDAASDRLLHEEDMLLVQQMEFSLTAWRRECLRVFNKKKKQRRARCK